ncbi:YwqI/YxiC family protein [Bacillus sp. T33-2]|uniref:YwqI/YxiC family protein n=1 Tax=Bacillus sp. T33-2 TaxID=2054168 RepID=UPI0021556859|nr:YwqI/YxiC family protein [Bacillus sp. T33-2]
MALATEIKIRYTDVEQALAELKAAVSSLETTFPSSIGGQNQLDVVDRLNDLNGKLQSAMEAYQALLLKNDEAVRKSVEMMRDTDRRIASTIARWEEDS